MPLLIAILRRVWDFLPVVGDVITVPDPRLGFRVAVAMAVALDAPQSR